MSCCVVGRTKCMDSWASVLHDILLGIPVKVDKVSWGNVMNHVLTEYVP